MKNRGHHANHARCATLLQQTYTFQISPRRTQPKQADPSSWRRTHWQERTCQHLTRGSARRSVRQQKDQQNDGRINFHSRRSLEALGQPMPSKIAGLSDAKWAACPVMAQSATPDLRRDDHAIHRLIVIERECEFYAAVCGACPTLVLASLMKNFGFSTQSELGFFLVVDRSGVFYCAFQNDRGGHFVRELHQFV